MKLSIIDLYARVSGSLISGYSLLIMQYRKEKGPNILYRRIGISTQEEAERIYDVWIEENARPIEAQKERISAQAYQSILRQSAHIHMSQSHLGDLSFEDNSREMEEDSFGRG